MQVLDGQTSTDVVANTRPVGKTLAINNPFTTMPHRFCYAFLQGVSAPNDVKPQEGKV
jgi:hypothetical protein